MLQILRLNIFRREFRCGEYVNYRSIEKTYRFAGKSRTTIEIGKGTPSGTTSFSVELAELELK